MRELKYVQIGERLREERQRVGMSQVDFAESIAASRNGLVQWERGETTPNAAMLGVMASMGVDVLYIATGARTGESASTLAPAERELLQAWRHGSDKGRALLTAAVNVLMPE
ncbi:helix-turn-helix domain-containing protein [Comamonas antarctica]|uniref:Helix-turn-helix transcriptional regulator n=1 Tax=Comamonas antarctica TaxID=2743470 RepID=A0A6N1X3M7_9BURK|nr:helix-turn-helix transcriptional regulator [Comamonas antarctica]QKV52632.1 helix-turn-helix transcriptional regulator [Comamonas antarctica]